MQIAPSKIEHIDFAEVIVNYFFSLSLLPQRKLSNFTR